MDVVSLTVGEIAHEYLTDEERAELDTHLAALAPEPGKRQGVPAPAPWRDRLKALFPKYVSIPHAKRHEDFWDWCQAIELESTPDPFCGFWPRGGGKSTDVELAVADLGCRGKRRYFVYIRETQEQADNSVGNIAMLLESDEVARHYPEHADRQVGKYGQSRGWRRNRITTAGGFVVDALGLDTASRGLKFDEQRPDGMVFDDIDNKLDGPHITAKKVAIITHSVLPAGASNCAVIFIQNLIIPDGVASTLADGRADFLVHRKVSGPHPAVEGLKYAWKLDDATGIRRAVITAGTATWEGQSISICQQLMDRIGLAAFLKECQHLVKGRAEGVALRFEPARHYIDLSLEECKALVRQALQSRALSIFAGLDFGSWRFAFSLWVVPGEDAAKALRRSDIVAGVPIRIDEYFAQRLPGEASLSERAQDIHEMLERYGWRSGSDRMIPIWGDAANPTDILELNLAFRRGWEVEYEESNGVCKVEHVTSRARVVAVAAEKKSRITATDRINDLLDKNCLRYRRSISYEWRYNMNAASEGTPMRGSRMIWEMENWSYPIPRADQSQKQDADDSTADGADMIAGHRYAILSWWSPSALPAEFGVYPDDKAHPFDYKQRKFVEPKHAADTLFLNGGGPRRAPNVRMPRPRTGGRLN